MQIAPPTLIDRVLFGLAFALLFALSLPGIEARAESDLAPSSRELLSLDAQPSRVAPLPTGSGSSCAAADPALQAKQYDTQREAMQRLAQAVMADDEAGEFKVLDGRGYGYQPQRDPAVELMRLQREAQAQARAPAEQPK